MRHKPLGVCSGIFHSDSQHRKLTFLKDQTVQGTRMGHEKVLPPCRHSLSLQIEHWCLLAPPIYKACGAINDSCPLQRSWGGYCRNKFQTQLTFKKPTVTSKFSSHPLMKRKKKKTNGHRTRYFTSLNITGGMPIKMTTRNHILPVRMPILTSLKILNVEERWEKRELP